MALDGGGECTKHNDDKTVVTQLTNSVVPQLLVQPDGLGASDGLLLFTDEVHHEAPALHQLALRCLASLPQHEHLLL